MRWLLTLLFGVVVGLYSRDHLAASISSPTLRVAQGPDARAEALLSPLEETAESEPASAPEPTETVQTAAADVTPPDAVGSCVTCHGVNGIAKIPIAPHLAGETRVYIETQLKAFRSGKRQHEMMSVIAQGLSDEDIREAAKWYAAIKIEATVPQ